MKFFLDENIPRSFVKELETMGFEVEHAADANLKGATDTEIAKYAKKQKAILITKDIEFGSFILYPKGAHHGLIILRLPYNAKIEDILKYLKAFLTQIKINDLVGKIHVIEIGRYRVRNF